MVIRRDTIIVTYYVSYGRTVMMPEYFARNVILFKKVNKMADF